MANESAFEMFSMSMQPYLNEIQSLKCDVRGVQADVPRLDCNVGNMEV